MSKKPILSALVVVAAAYTAYPYVALYRLQSALRSGDQASLAAMVDWDQVRGGLKDDIADQVMGAPEQPKATAQAASATLPPFGASFVKGVASKAVDEAVTPETITRLIRPGEDPDEGTPDPLQSVPFKNARLTWAFFQSPQTFTLWLRTPDEGTGSEPVKARMQLIDGAWKITRIWLPPDLLKPTR